MRAHAPGDGFTQAIQEGVHQAPTPRPCSLRRRWVSGYGRLLPALWHQPWVL